MNYLLNKPLPESLEETKGNMKNWLESQKRGTSYGFIILDKKTNEPIGTLSVRDINLISHCGEVGMWFIKSAQGKGYGSEALKVFFKFCFDELKLNRLEFLTEEENKLSNGILKKLGITKEAILKEKRFKKGKYVDEIVYRLLKSEWKEY